MLICTFNYTGKVASSTRSFGFKFTCNERRRWPMASHAFGFVELDIASNQARNRLYHTVGSAQTAMGLKQDISGKTMRCGELRRNSI